MPITKNVHRQEVLHASVDIGFADIASGVAAAAIEIPANAVVIGGGLAITTAFNSGTSDVVVVTGSASEALLASVTIQAIAWKPLTPTGKKTTAKGNITVTVTSVGTAITAGALTLHVLYTIAGRGGIAQG